MKKALFKLLFPSFALEFWLQQNEIETLKRQNILLIGNESKYDALIDILKMKCENYQKRIEFSTNHIGFLCRRLANLKVGKAENEEQNNPFKCKNDDEKNN